MSSFTHPDTYASLRLEVEQATTITPEAYRNSEFFQLELERLWGRSWVTVGYESEIPNVGDVLVAEVAGQSILIVRDRTGGIRAFHNVCRHRGSRLVSDNTNCKVLRCPYHGWGYNLDGELIGTPYFQGLDVPAGLEAIYQLTPGVAADFCQADHPLLPVQVDRWHGLICVNLSPDSIPFANWIGDLPTRFCRHPLRDLQLARRRTYTIQANWKLVAENFMEYYHLPWGHPELCNVSGFDNHYRYQGPGMYTGMATIPLTSDPKTVSFDVPLLPGLNETESQSAYFVLLFPNIALWMFPHHLVTLLYQPLGPDSTLEHLDVLVHPSVKNDLQYADALDRIMSFWCFVNDQDVQLVENVQQGLRSRAYPGGRLCYHFEEPVHRFQNMVADLMIGALRIPGGDPQESAPVLAPSRRSNSP